MAKVGKDDKNDGEDDGKGR